MTNPLVSVVIPSYNGSGYLKDCIDSILAQKTDCEIILVDDGSKDDSVEQARVLLRNIPQRMVVICQQNQGASVARNAGLRSAQGKYICFLDVDDRFLPGFFPYALRLMEPDPTIVAVTCQIELVNAHRVIETWQRELIENSIPSNIILRTEAARRIGGFPISPAYRGETAGEDCDFRFELYAQGTVLKMPEPGLKHLVVSGGHLDFFLDRMTLQDGKLITKFLSKEEQDGSMARAMQEYKESIRKLAIDRTKSLLGPTFDSAKKYHELAEQFQGVAGFLHPTEGFDLYWLAGRWPVDGWVVEIGSFKGRSTCWLATGCKERNKGKVAAVDHFRGSPEHRRGGSHEDKDLAASGSTLPIFERTLQEFDLIDWVHAHVGNSADVGGRWNEPIRILFIDGDHSYEATSQDFWLWSRHVAPHGLVVFHDVGVWPGVTQFYTELCTHEHWESLGRFYSLGILQRKEQVKPAEAITNYRRVLQYDPDNVGVLKALAIAHKDQSAFAEAAACFRQVLRIHPNDADSFNNLGNVLNKLGQSAEAIDCFREALRLRPDHALAHNNLGVVFTAQGHLDEAASCFRQALHHNPQLVNAQRNLSHVLNKMGRQDEVVNP